MKRLFFVIVAMGIGILSLRAQNMGRPTKEKMKAAKIGFLSTQLQLTTEEAKVFWPVYDAYDKEKRSLNKEKKLAGLTAGLYKEEMSEKEAKESLDKMISLHQRQYDLQKKYQAEFLKVLPATKVLALMNAEKKFHHRRQESKKSGRIEDRPAPSPPTRY